MFYELIKPAFFRIDPEQAHDLVMGWMEKTGPCRVTRGIAKSIYYLEDSLLSQTLWGLRFVNPVGMAAGFDKNARAIQGLTALGFGFIEIGTVTPRAQPGNPRPRIFRLPADHAVINRMGFPNEGADAVAARMAALGKQPVPIGINLGKNKDTALEDAAADYVAALEKLFPYGDYCVVNVSSPNTPGLRLLQGADYLDTLMAEVQAANRRLAAQHGRQPLPCLLKIAPDLAQEDLEAIATLALGPTIDGLIATNTTLSREGLKQSVDEAGGLSGTPLRVRSTEVIRTLYRITGKQVPIIGVGGIASGQDAYEKIRAGASLVQIYTAFIYEGPAIARRIKAELIELLRRDGIDHISSAIGRDV
ncbi:MAG: quinone-dependent dihydroorotate dehydrogenase [Gammaproteobacteria bacterium]